MNTLSSVKPCSYPAAQPRSTDYSLWVNGEPVDALLAEKADFAVFECTGPVTIAIAAASDAAGTQVKPLSRNIVPSLDGRAIRFQIDGPQFLCVDVPGLKPFFIYANAPEVEKPSPRDAGVHYFAAGRIYEAGEITLKTGETLYIEAGAVVRGFVRATGADRVSIRGQGILDGRHHDYSKGDRVRSVVFEQCTHVHVADIIMIEPTSWMLVFGCCQDVHVTGLKQIGSCMSSDGIDVCASRDVLIENCCLRNDDDNIAVKAGIFDKTRRWEGNIENVHVRHCVFLNGQPGNAMEIGYELSTDRVSNIVFEDIDVINAHGDGAVFSIHNGDRAIVENIRWENIRVEHYWDKLVDFRVVRSRYNRDAERGIIRNIHLKNIRVVHAYFNPGCSVSLISGYNAKKPVRDVIIEDFYLNDQKITSADELELHTRNAEGIRFL
ncbi:MAG: glycosyl hydrolase family 28 protein [Rariglobus sp.]